MKDSFTIYKDNHQYVKALNYSSERAKFYLDNKNYNQYIQQTNKTYNLLTNDLKDNKRAYKSTLDAINKTRNKAVDYERVKLLNNLSFSYLKLKKHSKAIENSKRTLTLARKAKNDTVIAKSNELLLVTYLETGKNDSAFKYLEPSLKSAHKIKYDHLLAKVYNDHFYFYSNIDEHDIAKKYLDSSLIYALKSKEKNAIETAESNLIVSYIYNEEYNVAEKKLLEILNSKNVDTLSNYYGSATLNISFVYEKLGDLKKAYYYQTRYVDYLSYVVDYKNDSELEKIKTQYELDKAENEYKEKELILKQKQLKNEKILYLLFAILCFLAVLFYFFYQNLKLRQKSKLKDVYQKTQQNIINATIDGQEDERKRLSSVLHDNISALLSSAGLHLSAIEANHPEIKEDLIKTKAILKEAHDKVRDLSHDLVPPVLEKLGLISALQDLCEKNSNSLIDFEFNTFITKEHRFNHDFETKIYFIVNELFNNIIKHSKATKSSLTLDKTENQLTINIEDNGHGFKKKDDKKEGLGLSQIKARIKNMNGSISINSKENTGTLIYLKVDIPEKKSNAGSQFHNI
ncbi:ATP-binding protein [Flavobacterium sp.]|uniref:ATP-binding protein n=1 Tax=Flavobacterium sp. TaxID=239 RepID=UPI0028BDFAE7|nr:ATP-binding protein [Flavobacterium sp.]